MRFTKLPARRWFKTGKGWASSSVSLVYVNKHEFPELYDRITMHKEEREFTLSELKKDFPAIAFTEEMPSHTDKKKAESSPRKHRQHGFKTWNEVWNQKREEQA